MPSRNSNVFLECLLQDKHASTSTVEERAYVINHNGAWINWSTLSCRLPVLLLVYHTWGASCPRSLHLPLQSIVLTIYETSIVPLADLKVTACCEFQPIPFLPLNRKTSFFLHNGLSSYSLRLLPVWYGQLTHPLSSRYLTMIRYRPEPLPLQSCRPYHRLRQCHCPCSMDHVFVFNVLQFWPEFRLCVGPLLSSAAVVQLKPARSKF